MTATKTVPDHRISQAVKSGTGRTSEQWNTILDRWDWQHKDPALAAQHLRRRYGLSNWWARTIIVRYQMERRVRH